MILNKEPTTCTHCLGLFQFPSELFSTRWEELAVGICFVQRLSLIPCENGMALQMKYKKGLKAQWNPKVKMAAIKSLNQFPSTFIQPNITKSNPLKPQVENLKQ